MKFELFWSDICSNSNDAHLPSRLDEPSLVFSSPLLVPAAFSQDRAAFVGSWTQKRHPPSKAPPDMQGVQTALGTHQKYQTNPFSTETCNVSVLAGRLDRFQYRVMKIRYGSVHRVKCHLKRSRHRFLTVKNGKSSHVNITSMLIRSRVTKSSEERRSVILLGSEMFAASFSSNETCIKRKIPPSYVASCAGFLRASLPAGCTACVIDDGCSAVADNKHQGPFPHIHSGTSSDPSTRDRSGVCHHDGCLNLSLSQA